MAVGFWPKLQTGLEDSLWRNSSRHPICPVVGFGSPAISWHERDLWAKTNEECCCRKWHYSHSTDRKAEAVLNCPNPSDDTQVKMPVSCEVVGSTDSVPFLLIEARGLSHGSWLISVPLWSQVIVAFDGPAIKMQASSVLVPSSFVTFVMAAETKL